MISVLLVDDQALVRKGMLRILNQEADINVIGECEDGDEVVEAAIDLKPDIVLMDVRMKRMDGISATQALQAKNMCIPVMMLTTFGDDDVLRDALSAGAAGFVLKDASTEDLIRATQVIASGGAWLDPAVTDKVLDHYRRMQPQRNEQLSDTDSLTTREREVLLLIAEGQTNLEIADQLNVSEATVKTHVSHIFSKLGARDRAAAIVYAYDHGIVIPGR